MASTVRWTVAICSSAAALVVAFVCVAYSGIGLNNAKWERIELPHATELFAQSCYAIVPIAGLLSVYSLIGAYRQSDPAVIIGACIEWLFAIVCLAFCILAWRLPHIIIGVRLD